MNNIYPGTLKAAAFDFRRTSLVVLKERMNSVFD